MFTQLHNYGINSINLTKHFMVSGGVEILKVVKFFVVANALVSSYVASHNYN
jgi:hypothetical protein